MTALEAYAVIGAVISVLFALLVGRVEPTARGGSIGFRLLVLPGAALLWPLVLARMARGRMHPPSEGDGAHGTREEKKA